MFSRRKKIFILTPIFIILTLFFIAATVIHLYADEPLNQVVNANNIFKTEKEYQDYVLNKIKFKDVQFKIVKIKKRDNFWKVAKRNKVNIDTLIGANPFWKDLLANMNEEVVVPSTRGTIYFVNSFEDIGYITKKYNISTDRISVQETSAFYEYYYKFKKNRKPLAIFVHGKKPGTEMMSEEMAIQFTLREKFRSPLSGRLSSFFGNRKHPIFKRRKFHSGLDIAARRGKYVGAARAGRVIYTGWRGGYGKTVIIQHADGYKTLYGHMSKILTRKGRKVKAGSLIGRVGSTGNSTGPHLHFNVWKNNKLINPLKILW